MSLRDDLESRFLDGDPSNPASATGIDWSGLSLGIVGSVILAWLVGFLDMILSGIAFVLDLITRFGDYLILLGESTGEILGGGAETAAESWAGFAGVLGPVAFPTSLLVVAIMILVLVAVVRRV